MAEAYFTDGTIEDACPPLEALLLAALVGTIGADPIHRPPRARLEREAAFASEEREPSRPAGAAR